MLTDPRKSSLSSSYTHKDIQLYKKNINPNVFVIQRINECDQRKNTKGVNEFYINANKVADHTVFVSRWLYDVYNQDGFDADFSVIFRRVIPIYLKTLGINHGITKKNLK